MSWAAARLVRFARQLKHAKAFEPSKALLETVRLWNRSALAIAFERLREGLNELEAHARYTVHFNATRQERYGASLSVPNARAKQEMLAAALADADATEVSRSQTARA